MSGWQDAADYVPVAGSAIIAWITFLAVRRRDVRFRRRVLLGVVLIGAFTVALYWSGVPDTVDGKVSFQKPPFLAYLALWVVKLKVMLASAVLVMLNSLNERAIRPLFYALIGMAGTVSLLAILAAGA